MVAVCDRAPESRVSWMRQSLSAVRNRATLEYRPTMPYGITGTPHDTRNLSSRSRMSPRRASSDLALPRCMGEPGDATTGRQKQASYPDQRHDQPDVERGEKREEKGEEKPERRGNSASN